MLKEIKGLTESLAFWKGRGKVYRLRGKIKWGRNTVDSRKRRGIDEASGEGWNQHLVLLTCYTHHPKEATYHSLPLSLPMSSTISLDPPELHFLVCSCLSWNPDCFLVALKALLEVDAWYLPPIRMLAFLLVHSSHSPLEFSQLPSRAGKHPA